MSVFAWLDYSEHDRRQMLDVIDLFREQETRDELGVGTVRDTFADIFFPGTSTIMTRARYFLLVPWIYRYLENHRTPSSRIADRARKLETDLIELIESSDDASGNIGKLAGRALKRLPSNIYWQGLGVWGIRTFEGAQSQYHQSLDRYYIELKCQAMRGGERDAEHDDRAPYNWHPGLTTPPNDFLSVCSLRLTNPEASYLAERVRLEPIQEVVESEESVVIPYRAPDSLSRGCRCGHLNTAAPLIAAACVIRAI